MTRNAARHPLGIHPGGPQTGMPDTALAATGDGPDLGALPSWDLNDLYPGMESAELKADLDRMDGAAKDFHATYAGKLAGLDGNAFAAAIREYERIDEVLWLPVAGPVAVA